RPGAVPGPATSRGRRSRDARCGSTVRHPRLRCLPPPAGGGADTPRAGARVRAGGDSLNAECGVRNAEWTWKGRSPLDPPFQFRTPHSTFRTISTGGSMKLYDLSQPLNERSSFWPYYPPFEAKYIKRKAEHGVNAQYIMTPNHMGTHLDAPRH